MHRGIIQDHWREELVSGFDQKPRLKGHGLCDSLCFDWIDMNTSLVKSAPAGDFAEVSALVNGWQSKLHLLVSQRQPIKYDYCPTIL
jgi:hypothetical protein